jgi:hypothetical protein
MYFPVTRAAFPSDDFRSRKTIGFPERRAMRPRAALSIP